MHYFLTDHEEEPLLLAELQRNYPGQQHGIHAPKVVASEVALSGEERPILAFARQTLPDAEAQEANSITAWGERLFQAVLKQLPENQPWRLHIEPQYGSGPAGEHRCRLIGDSLSEILRRKRRSLLRQLEKEPAPFTTAHSLVQLLLTSPTQGLLSVARAPLPFQWRTILSPFPKGEVPVASDKAAPSRAFAKLLEVEARLGRRIQDGELCVDLGASPGSWTYVALNRGAHVIAVDRAELRADLMRHAGLRFHQGDAFKFHPEKTVDWLLCDVIAAPQRSIDLLRDWAGNGRARRFVVTIKFKGQGEYHLLDQLKSAMPPLCDEFYLSRLCANKNETCAFGCLKQAGS